MSCPSRLKSVSLSAGKILSDWTRLCTLCTEKNGEILLELESIDPQYAPIPEFQLADDNFFTYRLVTVNMTNGCSLFIFSLSILDLFSRFQLKYALGPEVIFKRTLYLICSKCRFSIHGHLTLVSKVFIS